MPTHDPLTPVPPEPLEWCGQRHGEVIYVESDLIVTYEAGSGQQGPGIEFEVTAMSRDGCRLT